ncbi:MAG TPA: SRPBCC family protein [Longimicrobiales bacterium]|nr:SRPBCC family protein [Longimicrobiales bacterium]
MTSMAMGVLRRDARGHGVRFERRFDGTPEDLWPFLTEAGHLSKWITPGVTIEAREGGRIRFPWPKEPHMEGEITVYDPPSVLEYLWREGTVDSVVRLELRAEGAATLLVIDHSGLPEPDSRGFAAGWHSHLDWLALVMEGGGAGYDQDARFRELAGLYGGQPPAPAAAG